MEAEDGRQTSNEANEVSGSINHGRMSITEEEDEVGEDLCEEDDISNEDLSEDEDDEDYDIYYGGENEDLDDGRFMIEIANKNLENMGSCISTLHVSKYLTFFL